MKKIMSIIVLLLLCAGAFYYSKIQLDRQLREDLEIPDTVKEVSIWKNVENYYQIKAQYYPTGYEIIAKKVDGKFIKLYEGQDYISCQLAEDHKIPESIYDKCY
jgi:uncharacterized protein YxeA